MENTEQLSGKTIPKIDFYDKSEKDKLTSFSVVSDIKLVEKDGKEEKIHFVKINNSDRVYTTYNISIDGAKYIIDKKKEYFFLKSVCLPKSMILSRRLYEHLSHVKYKNDDVMQIKECTKSKKNDFLHYENGVLHEVYDIKTCDLDKLYSYHKELQPNCLINDYALSWDNYVNFYMMNEYGVKEYIKCFKNEEQDPIHKIGPNTYAIIHLYPYGTHIEYYIHEIKNSIEFGRHISIIKLLIDTLQDYYKSIS
jgi:hypothetical protein